MRLVAVQTHSANAPTSLIEDMHRLRARVFGGRLQWQVDCTGGLERDAFDAMDPTYLLLLSEEDAVIGCVRLLPADRVTMLEQVFACLLDGGSLKTHPSMIESSRFCVDSGLLAGSPEAARYPAAHALFAGIIEWGLALGYTELVTATDLRFERLLKMAGWPMTRLGQPRRIGDTDSVAGLLPLDRRIFHALKPEGYRSVFSSCLHFCEA